MKIERKPLAITASVSFVLAVLIITALSLRGSGSDFEFIVAARSSLIQTVEVTGRVKPASQVDLAFEKSGRVSEILFDVGSSIEKGDAIIKLANGDTRAKLLQARATQRAEEAKLAEFLAGTRQEEIELQEAKFESAVKVGGEAKEALFDALRNALTQSDDAIKNRADQFFINPTSIYPKFNIDPFGKLTFRTERVTLGILLSKWEKSFSSLGIEDDLTDVTQEAKSNLLTVKDFLDKLSELVNRESDTTSRNSLFTGRSNVDAALSALIAAEERYTTSLSNVDIEQKSLTLKNAGTRSDQIEAQRAAVDNSRALVAEAEALVGETIIFSPIDGLVTKVDTEVGEIVSANQVVTGVISDKEFEIEVDIPEIDIAKVSVGDEAKVTLDAYGNDVLFKSAVMSIDPAATVIEGVPTYTTTLQFTEHDDRLRSGMTADIDIVTETRENVIAIPMRAVIRRNGSSVVRIVEEGEIREVDVKTGVRGSDGNIEIISGIEGGFQVVTLIKDE